MSTIPEKQLAHDLIERLPESQITVVVRFLEFMLLDPVARAAAAAPPDEDGDTLSKAERRAVVEADEWLKNNRPIPHEDILAEFGLTMADWDKMADEPLPGESPLRNFMKEPWRPFSTVGFGGSR